MKIVNYLFKSVTFTVAALLIVGLTSFLVEDGLSGGLTSICFYIALWLTVTTGIAYLTSGVWIMINEDYPLKKKEDENEREDICDNSK